MIDILSMIETTSRDSFNLDQIKQRLNKFKIADGCEEVTSTQRTQNWGCNEAKCLVEIRANEGLEN